jgi:hypothetical protein
MHFLCGNITFSSIGLVVDYWFENKEKMIESNVTSVFWTTGDLSYRPSVGKSECEASSSGSN